MLDTPTYRPCPACRDTQYRKLVAYSLDPWEVVECASCNFVYLRNPPAYEALEEDFAWEKTYDEKKAADTGSTKFSPLGRKLKEITGLKSRDKHAKFVDWFGAGNVLDIGCGYGNLVQPPMVPFGIELSTGLHERADRNMRARGGYCLHGAGAEAIWEFPEDHFDGVILHSYLEHETDISGVLSGVARALKATGKVFIRVPNFASLNRRVIGANWCGFRYPDHVNYFTLSSLSDVAKRAGFETRLVNAATLPVDDNIHALLYKSAWGQVS
ncbi:MAG: class I SAM-dependent methyltransferase [Pseudomonadota bacterium]